MFLSFHLVNNLFNISVFIDDERFSEDSHVGFTIQFLRSSCTIVLKHFLLTISNQPERQLKFTDEFLM